MQTMIDEAAGFIKERLGGGARLGLILGSGLGSLVSELENAESVGFGEIPHFPVSSVKGHRGELFSGKICGADVIMMAGRVHFYEGLSMQKITFPVRVMSALGVKKLIITNAGGSVNRKMQPGDIVVISDHINLMGDNPLKGSPDFTDMTRAYCPDLRSLALKAGKKAGINLRSGVYVANSGPSYETPAEVRMAGIIGGDIVGMSTVPEAIVAGSCGIRVLGLSMITNMAAGITGQKLSHEEVISTTDSAQEKFKKIVREIIKSLAEEESL